MSVAAKHAIFNHMTLAKYKVVITSIGVVKTRVKEAININVEENASQEV